MSTPIDRAAGGPSDWALSIVNQLHYGAVGSEPTRYGTAMALDAAREQGQRTAEARVQELEGIVDRAEVALIDEKAKVRELLEKMVQCAREARREGMADGLTEGAMLTRRYGGGMCGGIEEELLSRAAAIRSLPLDQEGK